ncbi:MAG: hypothetical protein CVV05_06470 [Gammaproteobacteria bacterium HGW-Gammaproteobacteria-1]|jgi:hypothetical protein|nr:MAG: hypothetical protein CVV05_06470 [Gammaproteobacteria bacterium HGW-Gammaproteobacteria-1]
MFGFGRKKTVGKRGEPLPESHDGPPDSANPSGLCPRCEKQSSFDFVGSLPLTFDGGYIVSRDGPNVPTFHEQATVMLCRNCHQGIAIIEEQWTGEHRSIERKGGGISSWKGFHWWPLVGATLHKAVPVTVASAYHEAALALSANCPRAAAAMARRTLEAIAVDRGETTGTLAQRLANMSTKGLLHPTLSDWSREVRLIGNTGAHFDPINDVSPNDARQLIDFIRELAKYIYVLPFELNERRAAKP